MQKQKRLLEPQTAGKECRSGAAGRHASRASMQAQPLESDKSGSPISENQPFRKFESPDFQISGISDFRESMFWKIRCPGIPRVPKNLI